MTSLDEREERLLDVLDRTRYVTRAEVIRRARMDVATAGWCLAALLERGEIERVEVEQHKHSRPLHAYRLAMRRRSAA